MRLKDKKALAFVGREKCNLGTGWGKRGGGGGNQYAYFSTGGDGQRLQIGP